MIIFSSALIIFMGMGGRGLAGLAGGILDAGAKYIPAKLRTSLKPASEHDLLS